MPSSTRGCRQYRLPAGGRSLLPTSAAAWRPFSALRRKRGQRIGGAFACERQVPCGAAHEPCQDAGPPRRGCGDCRSSGQAPRRACPPALGQPCGLPTVPTASTTNVRKVAKPRRAARRPRSPDPLPPPSTKSAITTGATDERLQLLFSASRRPTGGRCSARATISFQRSSRVSCRRRRAGTSRRAVRRRMRFNPISVGSGAGAVVYRRAYLFPSLSVDGASRAAPSLRLRPPPHRTGRADFPHPAHREGVIHRGYDSVLLVRFGGPFFVIHFPLFG